MHIPGYRIIRKINHGGMSTVYLAIQESVGRVVALKVMSPALNGDPSFSERFQREANIVGQLSHPNIVSIYDIGRHNSLNYIAMDYLPGGSVQDKMLEGINEEYALRILREIASALDHAHSKGYVHRDIKPENILFRDDSSAVLTDFGVARALISGSRHTHAGIVVGTPHYMSPEQTRGKGVDARSDLYSLGIVFFEMLTGRVPYQGDEAVSIALKHLAAPTPTLPGQFIHLQSLLDKMLNKESDKRYQRGNDLVADIETLELQMRNTDGTYLGAQHSVGHQLWSLLKVLLRQGFFFVQNKAQRAYAFMRSLRYTRESGFYRHRDEPAVASALTRQNTLVATRLQHQVRAHSLWDSLRQPPRSYLLLAAVGVFILGLGLLLLLDSSSAPQEAPISARVQQASQSPAANAPSATQTQAEINETRPLVEESTPATTRHDLPDAMLLGLQNTADADTNNLAGENTEEMAGSVHNSEVEYDRTNTATIETLSTEIPLTENSFSDSFEAPVFIADDEQDAQILLDETESSDDSTNAANAEIAAEVTEEITEEVSEPVVAHYTLTVDTEPSEARVRIMNIRERYQPAIELEPGRYQIEVTHPGYQKYLRWVSLEEKDLTYKVALEEAHPPGSVFRHALAEGGEGPSLVTIAPGRITLGDPEHGNRKAVFLNHSIAVTRYEITFAEYEQFARAESMPLPGDNRWGREDRPVINISWEEATMYARWLREQTGENYRLPTEAEWEYIARAGKDSAYWWGDEPDGAAGRANCRRGCNSEFTGLFRSKTAPVGSFAANDFGVYDTAGNVAEWVGDCYREGYAHLDSDGSAYRPSNCKSRVVRGGSMREDASGVNAYQRRVELQHTYHEDIGFRLVVDL